jgi:hypothetical protein
MVLVILAALISVTFRPNKVSDKQHTSCVIGKTNHPWGNSLSALLHGHNSQWERHIPLWSASTTHYSTSNPNGWQAFERSLHPYRHPSFWTIHAYLHFNENTTSI